MVADGGVVLLALVGAGCVGERPGGVGLGEVTGRLLDPVLGGFGALGVLAALVAVGAGARGVQLDPTTRLDDGGRPVFFGLVFFGSVENTGGRGLPGDGAMGRGPPEGAGGADEDEQDDEKADLLGLAPPPRLALGGR